MITSLWHVFKRQCHREVLLCVRQPRLLLQSVLFFVMMLLFFPMTLPASPQLLNEVGTGLVWIATLFAALLSAEGLFQRAFEEGLLELAHVSGQPLGIMILAKLVIHTSCILIPLVLLSPIEGVLFGNSMTETKALAISLTLGAPALFSLTALASAFNVGRVQRTTLMALIVLPLTVPVMIFGAAVMTLYKIQGAVMGLYALLAAISLLCIGGLPFAIAAVLRLRFED